jgi:hypothetical protein
VPIGGMKIKDSGVAVQKMPNLIRPHYVVGDIYCHCYHVNNKGKKKYAPENAFYLMQGNFERITRKLRLCPLWSWYSAFQASIKQQFRHSHSGLTSREEMQVNQILSER